MCSRVGKAKKSVVMMIFCMSCALEIPKQMLEGLGFVLVSLFRFVSFLLFVLLEDKQKLSDKSIFMRLS